MNQDISHWDVSDVEDMSYMFSNATAFNWSEKGNILNIDFDGEIVTTSFYINSKGQLHLTDITNLYFIKLE